MRLRGIAFDSLRDKPLSEAFVAVVGGGWTTTSDARGRFEFERVPAGTYLLTLRRPLTVPPAYVLPGGALQCGAILAWTSYLFKNR